MMATKYLHLRLQECSERVWTRHFLLTNPRALNQPQPQQIAQRNLLLPLLGDPPCRFHHRPLCVLLRRIVAVSAEPTRTLSFPGPLSLLKTNSRRARTWIRWAIWQALWIQVIAIIFAFSVRRLARARPNLRLQRTIVYSAKTVLPSDFQTRQSLEALRALQFKIPLKLIRPRTVTSTKVASDPIAVVTTPLPAQRSADSAARARSCLSQTVRWTVRAALNTNSLPHSPSHAQLPRRPWGLNAALPLKRKQTDLYSYVDNAEL